MRMFSIWIILIILVGTGCTGATSIQKKMELRKDDLAYSHDGEKLPEKIGGTLSIGSFTCNDFLPADTHVTRTSTFLLPLLLYYSWRYEFQAILGYNQIANDYKQFMHQSLIEDVKRKSKYVFAEDQGDSTIDVHIIQITIAAPISLSGFAFPIPIITYFGPGMVEVNNNSAGPVDVDVEADVVLKRKGDTLLKAKLHGKQKTGTLPGNMWEDYTSMMINGLSIAIKDLNIKIVNAISNVELAGQTAPSQIQINMTTENISTSPSITGATYKDPLTGMEFVFVKGGCYPMGDTFGDGRNREKPVHEVCVNDFYISKYKVTQDQWTAIMGNKTSQGVSGSNYPVNDVNWEDAHTFSVLFRNRTGKNYRLPTEAEWEYAARSRGKKEKWPGTNNEAELNEYAWYAASKAKNVKAVGQKEPNGLGLYDMAGNAKEWVIDWYAKNYYKTSPKENPGGPLSGAGNKVLRGGSYDCNSFEVRTTHRDNASSTLSSSDFGFRLVIPVM